jgi:phage shock protein A
MSGTDAEHPDVVDAELVEDGKAVALPGAVAPQVPDADYTEAGVPGFDYVKDRIEKRFATSVGATELAGIGGKEDIASLDKKLADRDKAAKDKLAEIRRSMRQDTT